MHARLKKIFLVLGALLLIALLAFAAWYHTTLSSNTGSVVLKGLHGRVTIVRDQWDVPHISAEKSDDDAWFALGYVHAQDRLFQMDIQRRIAQGRLSEVLGASTLEKDKFLRTLGFYHAAEAAWPVLAPDARAHIQAYTDGVNAFLSQHHYPLPFWLLRYRPTPWTVIDSIAWQKMMAFDLQNSWEHKLHNYFIAQTLGKAALPILRPDYPANAPTILNEQEINQITPAEQMARPSTPIKKPAPFQCFIPSNEKNINPGLLLHGEPITSEKTSGIGSNAWVIDGKHSATGKPILANDPHLSLQSPAVWYLAELKGPHLHVIGATIPGLPAVVIGHNDFIAWGVTNANPDTQELYFEPENKPLTSREEVIHVRNGLDVNLTVQSSEHGPIITEIAHDIVPEATADKVPRLALQWTALQPNDATVGSFLAMNYAENWPAFVRALRFYVVPSQNFVYADTEGNIGYYLSGKIPLRAKPDEGLPIAATDSQEWIGYIPFDALPHAENPVKGYFVTANNKAVPDSYPYDLTFRWMEPPYRVERITELLTQAPSLSLKDMAQIQQDTKSRLWFQLKPLLLKTAPLDIPSRDALQLLNNWSGDITRESEAATIFAYWYQEFLHLPDSALKDDIFWREPLFIQEQLEKCQADPATARYLSETLQTALKKLRARLGDNPKNWSWGRVHHADFHHLIFGEVPTLKYLWNRSISTPGGDYTVNPGTILANLQQTNGASYRAVMDTSNWDHSIFIQSLGQSENPFSQHYSDFLNLWRDGRYIPMSTQPRDWGNTQTLTLSPG